MPTTLSLPLPPLPAQEHSLTLQNLLRKKIQITGKISFAEFMQIALYEPGLGYYVAGSHKLGERGDFMTAPETSDLFGMTIANFFSSTVLSRAPSNTWLELGAGSGKLCASILNFLATQNALPDQYLICEISPDLIARQQDFLKNHLASEIFRRIHWINQLPQNFSGIILANEVLDALPFERFQITEQDPQLFFVTLDDHQQFCLTLDKPHDLKLAEQLALLQKKFQLPVGYASEINFQQQALVHSLNDHLTHGYILLIDYGYPAKTFYHPDRFTGTFRCHYQQLAHEEIFFWPGLQDITAHVDFTAVARAGIESGLNLIYFGPQGPWLLESGLLTIAEKLAAAAPPLSSVHAQLKRSHAIQQLVSPNAMGEAFKVMLFSKLEKNIEKTSFTSDRRFEL